MPKRRTLSSSDEDVYHVEVITSARVNEDAEWEYLVSWAGYSSEEDSWEPAENVEQCDRLLRNFWKHVGMDNEDYSPGDQFDADESWIRKEREYFANAWRGKTKKKKKTAKDRHYSFTVSGAGSSGPKKTKKDMNKALEDFVQQQNELQSDGASDESDEVPLSRSLGTKSTGEMLPTQHRHHKGVQRQDGSDTNEDDLLRVYDEMHQRARRPSGPPGTYLTAKAPPSSSTLGNKRRRQRLSSPDNEGDNSLNGPLGKRTKTSQPTFTRTPATPPRGDTSTSHIRDSPSSLFSAPSSPAPILPSQPAAPNLSMPPPLQANASDPARRSLLSRPTARGSQVKAARKPSWLLEPKIKRFDAPNLKPGSTLPTKASLGTVRTLDIPQPSTSGRRGSIQTPTDPSTPQSSSATEQPVLLGPGPNLDALHEDSDLHFAEVDTPTVQDVPLLPPAPPEVTDAFLRGVMPPEMSEPMIDGIEPNRPPPPVPARKQSTSDLLKNTTIPRKFKWSGELRMNTEKDRKERLCNVMLSDTSDGSPDRLRFSICFGPSVSFLLLEKLFSLGELQCLRPALTPVAEIGKLGPETQADEKAMSTLFNFMSSRKLVSCSRVYLDDNQAALLLVFPATNLILCKEYNVRLELRKAGVFVAALLPWKVVGIKARAHRLFRDPCDRTHGIYRRPGKSDSIVMADRERSLRKDPSYHRALSILGLPKWLYDEMPRSKYCIWNKDGDGTPSEPGFETRALIHVLKKRGAEDVGLKADVSFVFVHVGAIKTLCRLPALMERRMKRLDIRFVTYGTHHTIPPARWGVRQIYPAGGIVCISPSVFAECPSATYRLLDMLEQHPLWDCFVSPGVVALAARQNQGSDPISEFEKGTLMHQDLLSRIGQGQVSLLSMEPPHYGAKEGLVLEWIRRQQETSMLEPRGVLEDCLRSFNKQFSDFPEDKWTFEVLMELSSTQFSLQTQPCMMDQYRRFVVITGKQDKIASDWGGLEWANIDAFNFRDEFFSKEKSDDLRSWANVEHALFSLALRYPAVP